MSYDALKWNGGGGSDLEVGDGRVDGEKDVDCGKSSELENSGELVWDPTVLEPEELDVILERFRVRSYCSCGYPGAEWGYDGGLECFGCDSEVVDCSAGDVQLVCAREDVLCLEEMLKVIRDSNYEMNKIGENLNGLGVKGWHPRRPHWKHWDLGEVRAFEDAIAKYSKSDSNSIFSIIHDQVKTKSASDCVEFYFAWKNSRRYAAFKERLARSRKDSLNTTGENDSRKNPRLHFSMPVTCGRWVCESGNAENSTDGFVDYQVPDFLSVSTGSMFMSEGDVYDLSFGLLNKCAKLTKSSSMDFDVAACPLSRPFYDVIDNSISDSISGSTVEGMNIDDIACGGDDSQEMDMLFDLNELAGPSVELDRSMPRSKLEPCDSNIGYPGKNTFDSLNCCTSTNNNESTCQTDFYRGAASDDKQPLWLPSIMSTDFDIQLEDPMIIVNSSNSPIYSQYPCQIPMSDVYSPSFPNEVENSSILNDFV